MSTKEEIKIERIKLTIRSRLLVLGTQYKSVIRNQIPGASDAEFDTALARLVENNLVEVHQGNRGGEIVALSKETL